MCRPAKIGALLTLLTLISWTASGLARGARIELIKRLWGIGEVRVQLADGSRLLERFATPHRVEVTEISADEALAFVWHQGDRPSLRLSIYDLRAHTRLADFTPGFGGDLETGRPSIAWSAPGGDSFVVDSIAWRRSATIDVELTMLHGEGRLTLRRLASGRMRASFARK